MRNIKRSFLSFIFAVLPAIALWGEGLPFSPLVRNWSTANQDAGRQNWGIVQDEDGVIYLANEECLLEFDGFTWRQIMLPGKANVRSVAIAPSGDIFVGSYKQFGYFTKKEAGEMEYHSLSALVRPGQLSDSDIWNIIFLNDKVYFQSFGAIYIYDGEKVNVIKKEVVNLFLIHGKLYSQLTDGGVGRFNEDGSCEIVVPRNNLNISTMLPLKDGKVLMASANRGLFIFDPKTLGFVEFKTEADSFIINGDINRSTADLEGHIILGSSSKGVVAIDESGHFLWQMDSKSDLQNETVLAMLCDKEGNIWAALDDGVSMIINNSSYRCFQAQKEPIGMIYDVSLLDGNLYLATNKGLYTLSENGLTKDERIKGQTWYVKSFDGELFIGNNLATYRKTGESLFARSKDSGAICIKEIYWLNNEKHLLEGTYLGIRRYDFDPTLNKWKSSDYIPGTALTKNIEIDAASHIWNENLQRGITRITLSPDMNTVTEVKEFEKLSGENGRLHLFKINGRIAFTDGEEFFTYDDIMDEIIPYSTLNKVAGHVKGVHTATRGEGSTYWLVGNKEIVQLDCSNSKYTVVREIPLSIFGVVSEDRSNVVYDKESGKTFLCLNNKVIDISKPTESSFQASLSLLECEVSDNSGKRYVISEPKRITTKRGYSHITFRLRYPEYAEYGVTIQYRLKGVSDNWETLLPSQMVQTYQRLKYRQYRYQAKVISADHEEICSIDIPVRVLSHWYSSRLMIAVYLLLLILIAMILGKRTNKHTLEMLRLKDRVDEANNAKDEMESQLKKKEEELAGMITGGIGNDTAKWDTFKQNFERVEEHFFSNLTNRYPDMTTSDLKFCALLRLNMSTKEIADALNITTRGVESARYRLRKKFGLKQSESLTAFIHNIK